MFMKKITYTSGGQWVFIKSSPGWGSICRLVSINTVLFEIYKYKDKLGVSMFVFQSLSYFTAISINTSLTILDVVIILDFRSSFISSFWKSAECSLWIGIIPDVGFTRLHTSVRQSAEA